MCFFRHLISPHVKGTSDKGKERDTLLYGNMQKGVFLSFLFRYNKKKRFHKGGFYEAFDRSRHAERFCYREPWNKGGSGDCRKRHLQNQRNSGRTDLCDAGHASGTVSADKRGASSSGCTLH